MGLMQLLFGKTIDRRIAEYQKELIAKHCDEEMCIRDRNRYARLGLPQPSGVQSEIVDGFTAIGQVRFSLPLSFWRKLIYFVALFTLPAIAGADAAFYAEPVSDLLGPAVSIAVYFLFMKRVLERRRAADGPPEA